MLHVDILEHSADFLASAVVARVRFDGYILKVDTLQRDWYGLETRPLTLADGSTIYPDKDPKGWFLALPEYFRSGYFSATDPHEDDECEFDDRPFSMRVVSEAERARPKAR